MTTLLESHGFTNATLEWKAWLDTVQLDQASAQQMQVLESSHPKAKVSDYYLLLVHQAEILEQRSTAFNAIMYAPGGLSRAERELASTVVSRINGCVYCASVHAQRFEQLGTIVDAAEQATHTATQRGEQSIEHHARLSADSRAAYGSDQPHAASKCRSRRSMRKASRSRS